MRIEVRRAVPRVSLLFLAFSLLSLLPVAAQTTNAPKPLHENRFLFIIETSRAMKSRSEGVNKVMEDLVATGIRGQLRRGDSIAVWTYNAELYVGRLPLQQWTPEIQKNVAVRITGFLKDQTYEKSASLQKPLQAMASVIKNSQFLSIILISDGSQKMVGTPFDDEINNLYKSWDKEQQKAHMPFVTVLQATKGKITHFTVTSAPWPVDMPPLPNELFLTATNAPPKTDSKTNASAVAVRKAPPVGQPLIISGKKPAAPEPRTNDTAVAIPNQQSLVTNLTATKLETPNPAPPTANELVAPAATPPSVSPQGSPAIAQTATSVPESGTTKPGLETPKPETSALAPAQIAQAPQSNSAEPIAAAASTGTDGTPLQVQEQPETQPASHPTRSPAQSVVVPSQSLLAGKIIWIAGLSCGLIVLILLMLKTRRNRSTAAASSLITRSFEKERKP